MLRPADEKDLPHIQHIRSQVGLFNYRKLYRWFIAQKLLYVAERENEVIGYVVGFPLRGGLGFCLQIGVLPSAQGQGTGARLMQCIENRMRDLGVTHLYAHTIKENSLYYFTTRLGYQEILRMSILALIYKKL